VFALRASGGAEALLPAGRRFVVRALTVADILDEQKLAMKLA